MLSNLGSTLGSGVGIARGNTRRHLASAWSPRFTAVHHVVIPAVFCIYIVFITQSVDCNTPASFPVSLVFIADVLPFPAVFYGVSLEYCNLHEACSAGARLSNVQHVVPCFRQLPSPHSPSSSLLAAEASGGCRAGCCCAGEWIAGTATVEMACLPQPANERKLTNAPPSASCHPAISRPLIFLSVNVPGD